MTANDFIKKVGFEEAQRVVRKAEEGATIYVLGNVPFYDVESSSDYVVLADLRHFIESHRIVELLGGVEEAKESLDLYGLRDSTILRLKQAIADVESCNA